MSHYIATFHTHLSALVTTRALKAERVAARMAPVPRKLSSSCGTCVQYEADDPHLEDMDSDVESVWLLEEGERYTRLYTNQ